MNDLKYIILGILVAFILSLIVTKIFMGGLYSIVFSFLVAGIIVGYLTHGSTESVAINGILVGFVGGIIFILFAAFMTSITNTAHEPSSFFLMSLGGALTFGMVAGVILGIISSVGSIFGSFLKSKT